LDFLSIYQRLQPLAQCCLVNIRLPSIHGIVGFLVSQRFGKKIFASLVGDIRRTIGEARYSGLKRLIGKFIVWYHEVAIRYIVGRCPTVVNGNELFRTYHPYAHSLHTTVTSTIDEAMMHSRSDRNQENCLNLLFVGQVIAAKGVPLLIEAVQNLVMSGKTIHCEVVGHGNLQAMLSFAHERAVGKNFTFRGHLAWGPSLFECYSRADIFVFPSTYGEGTPRVILEAMSQGLPVIATRLGGIPDVLVSGENGLLIEPASLNDLVTAILRISEDNQLWRHLSQGATQTARNFTSQAQMCKMLSDLASDLPELNAIIGDV
jgi:glycosyltransferase involved in cell wall biosynthesis